MFRILTSVRVRALACSVVLGVAAAIPVGAEAAASQQGGAPTEAEVHMRSLVGIPPDGYSLICTGQPSCTTSGTIDLETDGTVPVELDPKTHTTHGEGDLPYTKADGSVDMSWACTDSPGSFISHIEPTGTTAGKLAVLDLQARPGNTLAVTLDQGGNSGNEFPLEDVDRADGGCGSPVREISQTMGLWYYHFNLARTGSTDENGKPVISGLTWNNGVYRRTIDRFVTVGFPPYTYLLYESTTIEVEPEYCEGKQNQITSATSDGTSLGVDGMRFYPGQLFTVPPKTKMRLGDGSEIEMAEGGSFSIADCETNATKVFFGDSVGKFWMHFKHAIKGPSKKFDVVTKRMVAGVRGTIFQISYNKPKELTRLSVKESEVSLKGRNGARGQVMVKAGQVGVQEGTKAPHIIKR